MAHKESWGAVPFIIKTDTSETKVVVKGRDRWALECLIAASTTGCTPFCKPGPRWSAYVHNLRKLGVNIETINESHDGPFSGTHARYVLRSNVRKANAGTVA